MKVLSIGTDRAVFEEGSAARQRQEAYTKGFGELYIVVSTNTVFQEVNAGSLRIIPTNSSSRWWYGLDAYRIAKKLNRPDVVTVQDPFETGLIGLFIARHFGVPLHVQVHTDFLSKHFARQSFLNRVRVHIAMYVLRRAARIRVILESTKEMLAERGFTAPVTVLPIFVDTAKFSLIVRTKHPRFKIELLTIGRLEPEKNIRCAIDTLKVARDAGHDVGLTIVGSGSQEGILRARVRSLAVEHFVDFVGWQEDVSSYLASADALLVPSQYEGYGLVIIEALAAGIPVLATNVGVASEAGAIVAKNSTEFPTVVTEWISHGPRQAALQGYPYTSFEEYVEQYCGDIIACVRS